MLDEIDLHITNRCTTKCTYCCYQAGSNNLSEMSLDDISRILKESKKLGAKHVHITGGEPMIRQDIYHIIKMCKKMQFNVRMQTNGTLLTEENIKKLEDIGLEEIMISFDSHIKEVHDANRGVGEYEKALSAIKLVLKSNIALRVNSVITKTNHMYIYENIVFLYQLGVRSFSAFYFSPIGRGKDNFSLWLNPQEYIDFWNDLNSKLEKSPYSKEMNIIIEKGYLDWNDGKKIDVSSFSGCGGGCLNNYQKREYLIVRCDGNVYPCIMSIDREPLGNIHEKTLTDIYLQSEIWDALKTKHESHCIGCENYSLCMEGCRFFPAYISTNLLYDNRCVYGKYIPICPIMKYNYKNKVLGGSSDEVIE